MTVQTKDQSILKWKNTAHITKAGLQAFFAIAAIAIAATTIYAAAKGIALSSVFPAFLANPWVIATIAFVAAAYLISTAISSYQQIEGAKSQDGQSGQNGKDADFSVLLGDAVKGGTIVEEEVSGNKQLSLKLSATDYAALTKDKKEGDEVTLNVLLADKSVEIKFEHVNAANDNGNYKVVLTSPDKKEGLGMAEKDTSLKVAVSNKNLKDLKDNVATNLGEVAVNAAISKATGK